MRNAGFKGDESCDYAADNQTADRTEYDFDDILHVDATPPCFFFEFIFIIVMRYAIKRDRSRLLSGKRFHKSEALPERHPMQSRSM